MQKGWLSLTDRVAPIRRNTQTGSENNDREVDMRTLIVRISDEETQILMEVNDTFVWMSAELIGLGVDTEELVALLKKVNLQ